MAGQRRAGMIQVNVGGELIEAKGNWTYNLGIEKRDAIIGAGAIPGYKATPQPAFIEGEITDRITLNLAKLLAADGVTVTLVLGVGKTVVLPNAWQAAEGTGNTEEGNIGVRFESGSKGQEI